MKALIITIAMLGASSQYVYAEQTTGEKVEDSAKDAGRTVKKGAHRLKEKVCMKSDAKCLADKAKHRAEEAKDAVKDKGSEVKDSID